ncbi:leucine-rich repeat domain-containing protein [Spirochaeta africana]|uniref:Leucine Rich Repeat (LRR)-containing protein n=1 Tax=Spirochaeta africana (strain ATCC 700263 / DSM 8902 / Z-7692) TaxID=889378 RepID=H9UMA2_SPIAZ|nr:leucine-rich repeat domain-containing protein [Spirochaeta africana]AFG38645.1 Leucine Rich Repeat (LRR)-containing protein [Spirochaeta africana DSM 8902]
MQRRIYGGILCVGMWLLAGALPALANTAGNTSELIADAALRQAIADELGLGAGSAIDGAVLAELETLRARDAGIRSLAGLEHAVGLRELDLRGNDVRDLQPLAGLTQLEWLSLRENPRLQDIAPLQGLTGLSYLNLNRNTRIRSIQPLQEMRQLDTLILRGVRVLHREEEQVVIAALGPMERLNLRDTGLTTVAVLLPGLDAGGYREQLDVSENPLRDSGLLIPYREQIAEFAVSGPQLGVRIRAEGGAVYGEGPYYDMDLRLMLDAEPRSFIRVYGALDIELDPEDMEFELDIDEVFLQYGLTERWRLRVGKQKMAWGQALLLDQPGDFMADVDDGAALRLDADLLDSGANRLRFTGVMHAEGSFFADGDAPEFGEFAYAGRLRGSLGWFRYGTALWYRQPHYLPLRTSGYAGGEWGDWQLMLETVAYWDRHDFPEGDGFLTASTVWSPADWKLTAEYQYDSRVLDARGQRAAVRVDLPELSGWELSLYQEHELRDTRGEFVPRAQREILPYTDLIFELPITYGDPDSRTLGAQLGLDFSLSF